MSISTQKYLAKINHLTMTSHKPLKEGEVIVRMLSIFLSLSILLVSCASTSNLKTLDDVRSKNASNLLKLNIGMDKKDVLEIMGTETIQTYRIDALFYDKDKKIPNPYRTEIKRIENKDFEVIFYYTDIKKMDGAITDDELTPLIFDNGKLAGWGWSFFEEVVRKYEIEFRER